jgi:hypothetical protein
LEQEGNNDFAEVPYFCGRTDERWNTLFYLVLTFFAVTALAPIFGQACQWPA